MCMCLLNQPRWLCLPRTTNKRRTPTKTVGGGEKEAREGGGMGRRKRKRKRMMMLRIINRWRRRKQVIMVMMMMMMMMVRTKIDVMTIASPGQRSELIEKYGGQDHLNAPPKQLLLAQTVSGRCVDASGSVVMCYFLQSTSLKRCKC